MGTGIGEYCKRCGEQLNYDDGFEDGFCNRCYHIAKFETKNMSERAFNKEELEFLQHVLNDEETVRYYSNGGDGYSGEYIEPILEKISKLLDEENE